VNEPEAEIDLSWIRGAPPTDTLVLFFHGLSGRALEDWGPPGQPGAFAHRLAAEFPEVAVAVGAYPSQMKRFLDPPRCAFRSS
jgi:hypothetical protein